MSVIPNPISVTTLSGTALLAVRGLTHQFPGRVAPIAFVDLTLDAGSLLLVRGPSGCGKSTLLHLLAGVLPVSIGSGSVRLDGRELAGMSMRARDQLRPHVVGWMPQRQFLMSGLTVLDNVLLPVSLRSKTDATTLGRAESLLNSLAISDLSGVKPATLSVGQSARACLARALLACPQLLLADEPSAALDEASASLVAGQIARYVDAGGSAVVASHDPQLRQMLAASCGGKFSETEW